MTFSLPSTSCLRKLPKAWFPYRCICRICRVCRTKKIHRTATTLWKPPVQMLNTKETTDTTFCIEIEWILSVLWAFFLYDRHDRYDSFNDMEAWLNILKSPDKLWCCICRICRVCRTKKIHRTDRIHSISYKKLYLSFLLYWAFVREVSIKLYLSYEFFSYEQTDRYDRYNDMETSLTWHKRGWKFFKFFVRPRVVVGWVYCLWEQTGKSRWPTPLKTICGRYPKSSMGIEKISMRLVLSGSVRHFDIALLRKFTNHHDFALTVFYRLFFFQVPFLDILTSMLDPSLPLTVQEYEEWGQPE